jgi:hypothetical protein
MFIESKARKIFNVSELKTIAVNLSALRASEPARNPSSKAAMFMGI